MSIAVGIVEDDPRTRKALAELLGAASDFRLVGVYACAEEGTRLLPARHPEVVLVDILLPGQSGIECVRALRPLLPATQFMMLTAVEDQESIFSSILAGATGYLLKTTGPEGICEAVRELQRGGSPITASIARRVLLAFQQLAALPIADGLLSPQEWRVLEQLAHGRLYKEIADELGISFHTVRSHVNTIYKKLHVCDRAAAVRRARPFWRWVGGRSR